MTYKESTVSRILDWLFWLLYQVRLNYEENQRVNALFPD
jgi:hypothetical protein